MANQNVLVLLKTSQDVGEMSFANWGKGRPVRELEKLVGSLGDGAFTGSIDIQNACSFAYGALLIAAGAGAVGGTIGGQLVTATWAISDANSADLVAAALNADPLAGTFIAASSRTSTNTLTIAGGSGVITASIDGGASLGNPPLVASVTWAISDTSTAAALAATINALPNSSVVASSAAGVVTLYSTIPGSGATNTLGNNLTLVGSGTGVTVGGLLFAGGGTNANVLIRALVPGTMGNGLTLAASGTGVTAPTGARLVGGLGAPGNSFTC